MRTMLSQVMIGERERWEIDLLDDDDMPIGQAFSTTLDEAIVIADWLEQQSDEHREEAIESLEMVAEHPGTLPVLSS